MQITQESISKTQVKLTIELTPEEVVPYLEESASHISESVSVPGFRKGKATLEAVTNNVGEMRVLEEAIELIIRGTLPDAVKQEGIDTVGSPSVDVEKTVPGNSFVYSATLTLMPQVKKLADYEKLSVKAKSTDATEENIEKALKDLTRMQTKEVRAKSDFVAGEKDLVVVDMDMKKDNVPLDGGTGKGYRVYMGEDFYLPGMRDKLIGVKEGDKKEFSLTFPEDHFQKHIAGQAVDVSVEVKEIYTLEVPELDETFAKALGMESVDNLKEQISANLEEENKQEEATRQEQEMLEAIASKSSFSEIPDSLVENEIEKMIHELEHAVEKQGGVFADYLKSINKTPEQLRDGMREQAMLRVKVGIILKAVGKKEEVEISNDEAQTEIEKQVEFYGDDEERKKQVRSNEYREYMKYRLRNQKVISLLKEKMVK